MKTLILQQADRKRTNEREFIFIGSTPHDEDCTQAGYENLKDGEIECKVLINQLRRLYGKEPEQCEFFILENHHEFGIYHEAAIYYNQTDEESEDQTNNESEDYAFKCEALPELWDSEAKDELRQLGHTKYQPAKVIKMKAA